MTCSCCGTELVPESLPFDEDEEPEVWRCPRGCYDEEDTP